MRIIISPAKKMMMDSDSLDFKQLPQFIEDTKILLTYLKDLSYHEIKSIWKCNDKIAELNYKQIQTMDLYNNLTPAILSFVGIQYQYMAPIVFTNQAFEYLEEHLRILSGFYGLLKPFDGVRPYRLEMQANLNGEELNSLYAFWGDKLAKHLFSESHCILNLASMEYSQCISKYLNSNNIKFITCIFGEIIDNKVVEKGTLVKMARGEMVRFMAEHQIEDIEEVKKFNQLDYTYADKLSDKDTFVFIKNKC